jgi:hypothetical protein
MDKSTHFFIACFFKYLSSINTELLKASHFQTKQFIEV